MVNCGGISRSVDSSSSGSGSSSCTLAAVVTAVVVMFVLFVPACPKAVCVLVRYLCSQRGTIGKKPAGFFCTGTIAYIRMNDCRLLVVLSTPPLNLALVATKSIITSQEIILTGTEAVPRT